MVKNSKTKQQSLADQAHSTLEELIVSLKLAPGSTWTEIELCEMINIGRTPVHEAVQRLASQHLVSIMRRHGLMISNVNIEEQLQVLETRRELERLIVTRAARRISEDEKKELLELANKMLQTSNNADLQHFLRMVFVVKRFIAECARNPFASEAISPLLTLSLRFYHIHHKSFSNIANVAKYHYDEAKAVIDGNEDQAAKASDVVMDNTENFTRDIFMKRL